jgi:hypothetical protein
MLGGAACQSAAQPAGQSAAQPAGPPAAPPAAPPESVEPMYAASAPGLAPASRARARRDHSYTYLGEGGDLTVVGDSEGVARALSFRQGDASLLWFREGGQEYIVRDPDTLAQLEAAWSAPRRELDAEEARLDGQRDSLERRRRALAGEPHALEPSIHELGAQLEAIERQRDALRRRRELGPRDNEVEVRALFRRAITAGKATPARRPGDEGK